MFICLLVRGRNWTKIDLGNAHQTNCIKSLEAVSNRFSFSNKVLSLLVLVAIFSFSISMLWSIDIALASSDDNGDNGDESNNTTGKKVALVLPVFTWAAYQNGSFYNFYALYSYIQFANREVNITITNNTY
ncbi:MAG: hypothetical protein L0H53_04690, partial [Candidatus Nitrosocosmicus sp.]|nr:hypothetical protein [Candidatus Nitrosocosmicus sp.]